MKPWHLPGEQQYTNSRGDIVVYVDYKKLHETTKAGTRRWFKSGVLHRDAGPAVEYANGNKMWYYEGQIHRDEIGEDGLSLPAIDNCQFKCWFIRGVLHRTDGPARIWFEHTQYYRNGVLIPQLNNKFLYGEKLERLLLLL